MEEIFVSRLEEIPDSGNKVLRYRDLEIGVFRIGEEVFAWENRCAHQQGPVCQGRIFPRVEQTLGDYQTTETMRYSETELHIVCPWHGYEYNIRTGRNNGNPKLRLNPIDVFVRDEDIYVRI